MRLSVTSDNEAEFRVHVGRFQVYLELMRLDRLCQALDNVLFFAFANSSLIL